MSNRTKVITSVKSLTILYNRFIISLDNDHELNNFIKP